ncbi:MAG: chromosome segregation protein SMC [Elusimicrobia bacterium CG08_land_8_20_14_0_20_51_18]|nr:MAG: chromosome segregation protein SMC [Elusimicrobia bacterium CG08_land_8_20_14_0_20_51_18]
MQVESLTIKNFGPFKDAVMKDIPTMAVFVGANGSGKSSLFSVFGFLRDCLVHNVKYALINKGGFNEAVSRGTIGPISFEIKFREGEAEPLATYSLSIALDNGVPAVVKEQLKYRRGQRGQPWKFLDFKLGEGEAVINEDDYGKPAAQMKRDWHKLESKDILAIKGLGQFEKFKVVASFRKLIENWHVSDFHISDARPSQEAGVAEHLSTRGDNLPLVARHMYENYRPLFNKMLEKMKKRVPGIQNVQAVSTEDGRMVLKFHDGSFKNPFMARYVSDGTIKMFAYLLLLHDPKPYPLLCVEEPENQLYPQLLEELTEEFRDYARRGGQVFVSTHSPEFLNSIKLEEIYWLSKKAGYTEIKKASESELLKNLVQEGDLPGTLWKQGLFEGVDPK